MQALTRPWGQMHVQIDGDPANPCLVFANSLGTDLRLWDAVLPHLPKGICSLRYDKRGHGLSDLAAAAEIFAYAEDAIALIEAFAQRPVIFVGLSMGGQIAQAVAALRPDLLRGLVLSNTAAKLGTQDSWQARIDAVIDHGLEALAESILQRWFAPSFRETAALGLWRNMLTRTPARGYTAGCAVLGRTDLTQSTRALRLPSLVIAGAEDGASPAALVEATADLMAGADYHLMQGVGHLPCVEDPAGFAALLAPFLKAHFLKEQP
jgi:3-oxoadipate enol-lactonase